MCVCVCVCVCARARARACLWELVDKHREHSNFAHTCTLVYCSEVNSKGREGVSAMAVIGGQKGIDREE
jgi:hypothetical protein